MTLRDVIATRVLESGDRLKVRSALNPILWLCGIVTVPTLVLITAFEAAPLWLILLASVPVAVAVFGFLFLLFVDRNKLQSEDYQLRQRALEMIEQKGDPRMLDATLVEVIANPDLPQLPLPSDVEEA